METDMLIGIVVLALALTTLTVLTFWASRIIGHISSSGRSSARHVLKGFRNGPKA